MRLDDPNSNQEFLHAFWLPLNDKFLNDKFFNENWRLMTDMRSMFNNEIETQKHRTAPLSEMVTNLRIEVFEVFCERERKGLAVAGRCRGREN